MTPVEIARTYLGTKWVHQGRARHGLDCIGLLVVAFAPFGVRDVRDYAPDPANGLLERLVAEQFGPSIPREQMQPGDVVLMGFTTVPRHVGLVTDHADGLGLIHTNSKLGRVVEHRLDETWLRLVRYVHRWPEASN